MPDIGPQEYRRRRRRLRRRVGRGVILMPGNDESPINFAANCYPFRQDSSLLYYFGIDRAGWSGWIDGAGRTSNG